MSEPTVITFARPGTYLNMNDRDHWRTHARRVKVWRTAARAAAAHIGRLCPSNVAVQLDVTDSRSRDPHNWYPTVKPIIDGLVDAGLWPDDNADLVSTTEPTFRVIRRGQTPQVTVTITERAA